MTDTNRVFMVEDDRNFGTVMKAYLEINKFEVTWVKDGLQAFKRFKEGQYDICILDVMLPNVDGFTIAREIKEYNQDIPIIFLTAKVMKEDVLEGFSTGADDYITKPFDSEILICKINAILNRNKRQQTEEVPSEYTIGNATFNHEFRTITIAGEEQKLSPKEADLLLLLCQTQNKVLPRDKALKQVWGETGYFTTRSMDVYITKLRKYLKDVEGVEIINIHGSGYQLRID
ncbi:response regulator transcription factor [Carboxylicivirga mesophila]|uniref:Response regulator transcription factor n=1 Tax=Carboxylicivirga mesophila TaxID=1166478 RepID=A0ABS5KBH4_9BACT|nr:response regulator transcription factor [Carboxylicivirga mesophila]MBS2212394.1 response regulator transcription factor [Carboxylicivirga mesophila]